MVLCIVTAGCRPNTDVSQTLCTLPSSSSSPSASVLLPSAPVAVAAAPLACRCLVLPLRALASGSPTSLCRHSVDSLPSRRLQLVRWRERSVKFTQSLVLACLHASAAPAARGLLFTLASALPLLSSQFSVSFTARLPRHCPSSTSHMVHQYLRLLSLLHRYYLYPSPYHEFITLQRLTRLFSTHVSPAETFEPPADLSPSPAAHQHQGLTATARRPHCPSSSLRTASQSLSLSHPTTPPLDA